MGLIGDLAGLWYGFDRDYGMGLIGDLAGLWYGFDRRLSRTMVWV